MPPPKPSQAVVAPNNVVQVHRSLCVVKMAAPCVNVALSVVPS